MKLKFLSSLTLFICLVIIYLTGTSSDNGIYNGGTSCSGGGCHATGSNTNTTVALTGLPTTFITNQVYTLTFTVTNSALTHSGFNILCSAGAFTLGTGSKTNTAKTQITHTGVSSTNTWTFTWKAPATNTAVTFNCAGNAVDNLGSSANDQWNTINYTVPGTFPTNVSGVQNQNLTIYPNPATTEIRIQGAGQAQYVDVRTAFGQKIYCQISNQGPDCVIYLSSLPSGIYIVSVNNNGQIQSAQILKN